MGFLKTSLGPRWIKRIIIIAGFYLILIASPIFIFWNDIKFNAAAFTQEWVKTIASLSIIFIILEFQKYFFELNKKKSLLVDNLNRLIIDPVEDLLKSTNFSSNEKLMELKKKWDALYPRLISIDLNLYSVEITNKKLYKIKTSYMLDTINDQFVRINLIGDNSFFDSKYLDEKLNELVSDCTNECLRLK